MLEHIHGGKKASKPSGSLEGWGHTYDFFTGLVFGGREAQIRSEAIERAGIRPGERVLEVGCGTGTLTLAAKRAAGPDGEVFGVDVAEDMLETARKKSRRASLPVTFERAGIEDLPFPAESFDVILSSLMLHHVQGDELKRRGLAEVYRVLKPGGRLLIVEFQPPASGHLKWLVRLGLGHSMSVDYRAQITQMLQETGFSLQPVAEGFRFFTYFKGVK